MAKGAKTPGETRRGRYPNNALMKKGRLNKIKIHLRAFELFAPQIGNFMTQETSSNLIVFLK